MKAFAALLLSAFWASPALSADKDDSVISYVCDDLVIVGRLHNQTYDLIDDPDDLLGHGLINARVRVNQALRGPAANTVNIRYVAHAQFIESEDFLLVLKPLENGFYWLKSANLMDDRFYLDRSPPVLAKRCSQAGSTGVE